MMFLANEPVPNQEVTDAASPEEQSHTLRDNPRKTQCQVEGCRISLPKRRAYHKRYRICSYHATLSQMVLEGRHMRFCQQCGRFQLLSEFEGDKRSCRAKLDLHNARRKQARAAAIRFAPDGDDDDDFGSSSPPRKLPSTGPRLASMTHRSGDTLPSGEFSTSSVEAEVAEPSGARATGVRRRGQEHGGIDELLEGLVADGKTHATTGGMAKNNHHQDYQTHGNVDYQATDELLRQIINAPILPLDLPPTTAAAGSVGAGSYQAGLGSDIAPFTTLIQAPPTVHLAHAVPPQHPSLVQRHLQHQQPQLNSYQIAEEMLSIHDHNNPAVEFEAPYDLTRVSFKLFNVHPSELPPDVSAELQSILQTSSYLSQNTRIGCTHLSVEALLSRRERKELETRGSLGLLENALTRGHTFFPKHTFEGPNGKVVSQIGSEVSVKTGSTDPVTMRILAGSSTALCVNRVMPVAAVPEITATFHLFGSNISGCQDMIVCRQGPNIPNLEVIGPIDGSDITLPVSGSSYEVIEFVLPRPAQGLHTVEVQRGSLLSATSVPFLIVDNAEVVAELRQLECNTAGVGDEEAISAFLRNVGVVLDFNRASSSSSGPSTSDTTTDQKQIRIAEVAQRVAATCISRGWPALLRLTLPAMVAPGTDPATAAENFKSYSTQGLSMLHLAVLSRCVTVVHVLADWASDVGYTWVCEAASASATGGVTPLHLACLIDDDGVFASVLTTLYSKGLKLWTTATTSDQARPIDFAVYAHHTSILTWLKKQGVEEDVDEEALGTGGGDSSSSTTYGLSNQNAKKDTSVAANSSKKGSIEERGDDKKVHQSRHGGSRGHSRITRAELEHMRAERKNSYIDTICQEMKLVEEEIKALPLSFNETHVADEGQRSDVSHLLPRGAVVVATAGAAALGAYLRTMHLQ